METVTQFTFRVPKHLRTSFQIACKNNGFNSSLVLRKLMEHYVQDNAQMDLLKQSKTNKTRSKK